MTRAGLLVLLASLLAGSLLVPSASAGAAPDPGSAGAARRVVRPNIVLVMTDDQRLDDLRWMPRTRHLLGDEGVTFTQGLSPNPLCCPARASLLTGQLSHNNGVWTNYGPHGGYPALRHPHDVLPVWLQRAGYRTALVGKWLHGYVPSRDGRAPGWTSFDPTTMGTYSYWDYFQWTDGTLRYVPRVYHSTYVTTRATALVDRFSQDRAHPFFLWASYIAPHDAQLTPCDQPLGCWGPPKPSPVDRGRFADATPPSFRDPAFNERDRSDKAWFVRSLPPVSRRAVTREFRQRIRSLVAVDRGVARIAAALRRNHELANTVFVFTSDNGYVLGEHRYVGKTLPFEQSLRVPLLVRGPGIPRGRVAHQTATSVDLTRTFTQLAGATAGRTQDGVSLVPYLRDPSRRDVRPGTLVETGGDGLLGISTRWLYRGFRGPRFTYAYYPTTGFTELYDRRVDPAELTNVASAPAYAKVAARLRTLVRGLAQCAGLGCVKPGS